MKTLIVMAPDGEFKREGEFADIQSAWNREADMGSRWFFYPVHLVTTGSYKRSRIAAVPADMPQEWVGSTLGRLAKAFSTDEQHVCDWVNGTASLCLWP